MIMVVSVSKKVIFIINNWHSGTCKTVFLILDQYVSWGREEGAWPSRLLSAALTFVQLICNFSIFSWPLYFNSWTLDNVLKVYLPHNVRGPESARGLGTRVDLGPLTLWGWETEVNMYPYKNTREDKKRENLHANFLLKLSALCACLLIIELKFNAYHSAFRVGF